ncbi:MAG: alpha-N-acetylglucosaminidase C-terminal domain-containing protein, partial [Patescibacteria group bacterium]|nr:alpha-N-acetylglucosaminidase C-terminal domain-containing protein [Patescibacteria group bacterium]
MRKWKIQGAIPFITAMILMVCTAAYSDGFSIVKGARSSAFIVLGDNSTWIEQHAASELQKYISQMSGANLEISKSAGLKGNIIAIGRPGTNPLIDNLVKSGKLRVSGEYPGLDGFVIKTVKSGDKNILVLSGSMDRSTLYAVYDLLASVLHCGFFWDGDYVPKLKNVTVPQIDKASRPYFPDRQYNQGCAFSYTQIFWNLSDWKKELDWCAKKKQNLIYIPAPAPRDNMDESEKYQVELYKEVHKYARQLGIRVILPAGGGKILIDTYGTDHIYNADPYPEFVWSQSPEEVKKVLLKFADDTYNSIKSYDKDGIWYASGWAFYADPVDWSAQTLKDFMDVVPKNEFYVSDLWCDNFPVYKKYDYFNGRKWAFGIVQTMGRMHGMHGDLEFLVKAMKDITNDPKAKNCTVTYINPESIHHNNIYFDLATELSWDPRTVELDKFIDDYSLRRYGKASAPTMAKAWKSLEKTVYHVNGWPTAVHEIPLGSPSLLDNDVLLGLSDRMDFPYSTDYALKTALKCQNSQTDNVLYQNDLVDMFREHIFDYLDSHFILLLSSFKEYFLHFF